MHAATYAMTGKFADNAITSGFTMVLNGIAYITKMMPSLCCFYSLIKSFFRRSKKSLYFRSHIPYTKRITRIAIKSIKDDSTVDGDYLPLP